jgi:DNA-binding NarL/FixJ family response regulator
MEALQFFLRQKLLGGLPDIAMTISGGVVIRVLVADDELLIRAGIRLVLGNAEDIEVVAEASDGRAAVELTQRHAVDVVLLDIRMPGMDGLTAAEEMIRYAPGLQVVMLTTFGEDAYVARALRAGAAGFLLKDTPPEELIRAVRVAAAKQAIMSPEITRRLIDQYVHSDTSHGDRARRQMEELTAREREIVIMVGHGLSNAEIARKAFVSEGTIKATVSRIFTKLGCANRVQAAIMAHDAGMLTERI